MDGLKNMSRDELRSIVSKLKIMKYRDIQKLRKNELIDIIKFKEIFPFEESFFDKTEGSSSEVNNKIVKKGVKFQTKPKIKTDACSICLDTIKYDKLILPCTHHFHYICILVWFKENMICPVCRQEYKTKYSRSGWEWVIK